MNMKALLAASALLFFANLSNAQSLAKGPSSGNGGDGEVGLDFKEQMTEVIKIVKQNPQTYPEFRSIDLAKQMQDVKILVSNEPLYVERFGVQQMSVAKNLRQPDRIVVHRDGWRGLVAVEKRQAIALHEICGLLNLEKTGEYHISERIVAKDLTPEKILSFKDKYAWEIASGSDFRSVLKATLVQDFTSAMSIATPSQIFDGRFLITTGCMEKNCTYNRMAVVMDIQNPMGMLIVRKQVEAGGAHKDDGPTQTVIIRNRHWYIEGPLQGSYLYTYPEMLRAFKYRGFLNTARALEDF